PSRMIPPITIIVVSNKPRRRVAGAGQPPGGEITPAPEQAAKPEAELPSVPYAPDAVSETGVLSFSRTAMTIIEITPHGNGWKVFEAPGVEPVFPQKNQAINYAQLATVLNTWQTPLSRIWRLASLTGFNFPVRHCGNIPMR